MRRDLVVGEKQTATQFGIRHPVTVPLEIPFQVNRVYTNAICGVRRLENYIERHGIYSIFEPAP
jgi:hypothetical protein